MSNDRFIISVKNTDKCPPDYFYLCGAKTPVSTLSACISRDEVLFDNDPECGITIQSLDAAVYNYGLLKDLGFEGILVLRKKTVFENMDSTTFDNMVKQSRINSIIEGLDADDIKYLEDNGVLDLTIVT